MTTTTEKEYGTFNKFMLKVKYSLYSTFVFFLFANPETFKIMQQLFGTFITFYVNSCPTITGMFTHTILFFFTMLGLMLLPPDM